MDGNGGSLTAGLPAAREASLVPLFDGLSVLHMLTTRDARPFRMPRCDAVVIDGGGGAPPPTERALIALYRADTHTGSHSAGHSGAPSPRRSDKHKHGHRGPLTQSQTPPASPPFALHPNVLSLHARTCAAAQRPLPDPNTPLSLSVGLCGCHGALRAAARSISDAPCPNSTTAQRPACLDNCLCALSGASSGLFWEEARQPHAHSTPHGSV